MDLGKIELAVRTARTQADFIRLLLVEGLDWPVERGVTIIEDISYGWTKKELESAELDKHFVDGRIWQVQPLDSGRQQPWGIFILEFAKPDVFTKGRGITGPLRRILRGLVPKRRQQSNHAVWDRENLLFICTHNYVHFSVAYFKQPPEGSKTAPLAIFGWGPDIPARTAIEINLPALAWPDEEISREAWVANWASAFDVEKVTRKFYAEYATAFRELEDAIDNVADLPGDSLRVFTQMLFNRLMFLRFIERKGWLKFGSSPRYLQELFTTTQGSTSFYKTRLRRLFFEGLADENHAASDVIGDVPFLNGGLFDPVAGLDDKVEDIPNAAFESILGKSAGLFYQYNFTIEESTPINIQVAVDPEMLGKVFEELVTGRHETGSYYTPRPVVAFMCREALKAYLADKLGLAPEPIARLVDNHEVAALTVTDAQNIIKALDNLKAVDPACGSGAYLLGLLQEMLAIYDLLYSPNLIHNSRSVYTRKLDIISNNLYGVDIDPFATNIAMLRLWLSIAVDSETPLPLPNLNFKIETGDSLLGECDSLLGRTGMYADEINSLTLELARSVKDHVKMYDRAKKEELTRTIETKKNHLKHLLGVTDKHSDRIVWPAEFPEVFAPRVEEPCPTTTGQDFIVKETYTPGGFDVVLANPPYVRQELITALKPDLKGQFPEVYAGAADLYVYFYARAIQMLRTGGVLAFIAPNKFFRAQYGEKLRAHLVKKCRILDMLDFGDYPIFQAITYPSIIVAQKWTKPEENWMVRAANWDASDTLESITQTVSDDAQRLAQRSLSSESWRIICASVSGVIQKLRNNGQRLGELLNGALFYGIKTGCNEVFEIDEETRSDLIRQDPRSDEIIRPWLRGRNVGRWTVNWDHKYLLFARRGIEIDQFPAVKKYLKKFRGRLEPRPDGVPAKGWKGRKPGGYRWYEVQDAIDYWQEFDKPKLVYQVIATYQQFAYTEEPFVSNDKTWIIPNPPEGLLGYLNSKVAWFFLDQITAKLQGGAFELRSPYMAQIPIPRLSRDLKDKTRQIWDLVSSEESAPEAVLALEKDIDEIVVGLCGLTSEDVKVVDEAVLAAGNRFPRSGRVPGEIEVGGD